MMQTAAQIKDLFQSADFTKEKHVPVIAAPERAKKGEFIPVVAVIGPEIPHPNTTAHHIQWLTLYFQPQGEKYSYEIGHCTFGSHGASVKGPDTSSVYTHHELTLKFKTDLSGTIFAAASCNIHGLWQSSKEITVE